MTFVVNKLSISSFISLSGLLLAPAAVANESPETLSAYAAGYRAGFTCSALHNANKSAEQIERDELTGIYPLIADTVTELSESTYLIEHQGQPVVSVKYSDVMPPRYSWWRPQLGCVDLPVGAELDAIAHLPKLKNPSKTNQADSGEPWQHRAEVNAPTDNAELNSVLDAAFTKDYGSGARTSAVLVVTPDTIIAERYRDGFTPETAQRTWSVAKSIGASVIGAAVQREILAVDEPAGLKNWSHAADPRSAITLENLLHMASGLDSNAAGNRTDRVYMGGGLVSDTATQTALEAKPGTRWKYANNDTMLAMRVLHERMPSTQDYLEFPFDALLEPLGMHHTSLETDWRGDFILSSQVWTTARDLARLGVLHLQNGNWQGEQLLPSNWLEYVSTPAPAQPKARSGSDSPVVGYGAQWWLFNDDFPGLPNDTIAARGNRGQFLIVIPSKQLVIVRRGYDLAGEPGFDEARFAADVLATLKE